MDLAKTAEVKAVLQEAADAAAQQAEATKAELATISTTEGDSLQGAAATAARATAHSPEMEPAEMIGPQIGPPERPQSQHVTTADQQPQIGPPERPPSQTAVSPAELPSSQLNAQLQASSQTGSTSTENVSKQPDNDRPVKKQKVALSFDEDEDDS